jgi:hypothetical protein
MAWNTVHPYLLDRLNEEVGESYKELDEVFGLDSEMDTVRNRAVADGGIAKTGTADSIQTDHIETLYFDILKTVNILDPAVGSGAFLLAVQEVLLDAYLSCIEHFQDIEPFERTGRVQDELERIEANGSPTLFAKHEIILNNLYGVDIDQGAVEICKLRLWLSMVADIENDPADVEPLPNIEFNIRQGNSLIGYTEVTDVLSTDSEGNTELGNFGGGVSDRVRDNFEEIIEAVEKHKNAVNPSNATDWRNLAESRINEYRQNLNQNILEDFHNAGIEEADMEYINEISPFHWVLEFANVYSKGGFDVLIGNPPWEQVKPSREEFFIQYDELFGTKSPNSKEKVQQELLQDDQIKFEWENYKEKINRKAEYYNNSSEYDLQTPTVAGRSQGSDNDLSALFLERVLKLTASDGYVSQILPGAIFNGSSRKDLRAYLLDETDIKTIVGFENKGTFEGLHRQFKFGVITFSNNGKTDELRGGFGYTDTSVLNHVEQYLPTIPKLVLSEYSPEAKIFPFIQDNQEVKVLKKILDHPQLSEDLDQKWNISVTSELDRNLETERFFEDKRDYPIIGGKNIHQYLYNNEIDDNISDVSFWSVDNNKQRSAKHRLKEKGTRRVKRRIFNQLNGTGSQKSFVNGILQEERGSNLSADDVLLDSSEYRVVFRKITNSTNERTMIAAVLPPNRITEYSCQTVRRFELNVKRSQLNEDPLRSIYDYTQTDKEMFLTVGLLNSVPFDFLMRTKINTNIPKYKLEESQVPRLTEGDDWFDFIWTRSARLNCYGDEFEEMRERLNGIEPATDEDERRELQAEIDAGAFHAYGLDEEEVEYVLNDFHRVQNPRRMTESYFELVKKKYRGLQSN